MSGEPLIHVENVVKKYGNFTALKGISFNVNPGDIVGFLGPNGAGKTTTMKIITGYIPATRGSVTIDGLNIFTDSLECRRKIGYLPEDVPLYDDMKVTSYLTYVCRLQEVDSEKIPFRIDKMIESCNLEPVKDKLIKQLSKGNRQRVGLAQALIHEPEILILDEPTIGLDPKQVVKIRDLITQLGEDRTVILSTHILSEVEQMCDRVIIINEGSLSLDKKFSEISKESEKTLQLTIEGPVDAIENFLKKETEILEKIQKEDSQATLFRVSMNNNVDPKKLAKGIIDEGWGLLSLEPVRENLETLFLEVTMK